jgi:hypothetical protein
MNVAFNPSINYGTMYRPNINKTIRKMETPTSLPQTSYYKDPIPSVFHSKEDCGVGETYLNCAFSGSEGDPNNLPCNFYKPADYNEDDPVYIARVYPWDGSESIVKEIHLKDVDLTHANEIETFAYGIYLKDKGEIANLNDILTAYDHAHDNALSDTKSNLDKVDVISAIREYMEAGLKQGYYNQYVDYLALFNAIERNSH